MKNGSGIEASRLSSAWQAIDAVEPVAVYASNGKRAVDLAVAIPALIFVAPIMGAIALAVKLGDEGPALFRQPRCGVKGETFECLKFRTMRKDAAERLERLLATDPEARAEWDRYQKLRKDPRVTAIGSFLRKTSLDELPQLWNILKGEMSIIGPRPITTGEIQRYGRNFHYYTAAKPGVIGMWQVNGRNKLTYDERVELDIKYTREWTFWTDIKIMAKAVPAVLFGGGAY